MSKADGIPVVEYNTTPASQTGIVRWWTAESDSLAQSIFARVKQITSRQGYRRTLDERHARLYSNLEFAALSAGRYADVNIGKLPQNRVTWNVIKSCVDTAAAKIAKNKPLPLFLTEKGQFSDQRRAKNLTQYVGGIFDDQGAYDLGPEIFTHAGIYGTGGMKAFRDADGIRLEKIFVHECVVDDIEAYYGRPQSLYHWTAKPREYLIDKFAGKDQAKLDMIKAANPTSKQDFPYTPEYSDQVEVIEAWHLPSGPDAKDGKHVIALPNGVMFTEEWKHDYFPIVFFKWSPPIAGFYGTGIAWELEGSQVEINKTLRDISQAHHLIGVPRVFVDNSTQLGKPITNEIGSMYRYSGKEPIFSVVPPMHQYTYEHLERLWQKAFQQIGISELSAASRKPAGLDSGKALREYNDIETERFVLVGQRYEVFFLRLAKIVVDLSRELYTSEKGQKVKLKGAKFIRSIDWNEVDLEEDKFIMQAFPTSFLRSTPAGKLQDVQELLQAGLIDRSAALAMLDFPDLQSFVTLETSSYQTSQMIIESILEEGKFIAPEPFMDLTSALKMAQNAYMASGIEGAPKDHRELLVTYMEQLKTLIGRMTPKQTPAALPAPAQPQAAPPEAALAAQAGPVNGVAAAL